MFTQEGAAEILNYVDQLIGKHFTDLGFHINRENLMVKITFKCRACNVVLNAERCVRATDWSADLMKRIATTVNNHMKKHELIMAPDIREIFELEVVRMLLPMSGVARNEIIYAALKAFGRTRVRDLDENQFDAFKEAIRKATRGN